MLEAQKIHSSELMLTLSCQPCMRYLVASEQRLFHSIQFRPTSDGYRKQKPWV